MSFGALFGGEEKVAQARLAALENFPKIQREDWVAMRKFLDALETYAHSGPFDPHTHSRENVMTMTLVKRRMPSDWYQNFLTWCLEHDQVCIPSNFLAWANNRVDPHLLDLSFATNINKKNATFLSSEEMIQEPGLSLETEHPVNVVNTNNTDICAKCSGGHTLKQCEQFYLMAPVDQKEFIITTGRCLCCLGSGHRYEQCYSKGSLPHLYRQTPSSSSCSKRKRGRSSTTSYLSWVLSAQRHDMLSVRRSPERKPAKS